jgi:hypothetical protein
MNVTLKIGVLLAAATGLSGCLGVNSGPGPNGELPIIARSYDTGFDSRTDLGTLRPAVVYDPDGCQGWIIDSGVEGYSSRRRDPITGLPVCNDQFPPGTVVGNHLNGPFPDFIPNARR